MTRAEVTDFVSGYHRRRRDAWERTRLLGDVIARVNTGKPLELSLPWDDEPHTTEEEPTAEEFERLEALAREWEQTLNNSNNTPSHGRQE